MKYNVLEKIRLKTSKGGLELLPGQVATLPNKIAGKLLNEGRITPCNEILDRISDEVLQDLFLETMNRINDVYTSGTIRYIEEHHKDLNSEIDRADENINEIWRKCNNGGASIESFKGALDSYQTLYLEAIELFKSKAGTEGLNVAEIG